MRKSLGSILFSSLKRIGKAQQRQQKKLVKSLSTVVKRASKPAIPVLPAKTAKPKALKPRVQPLPPALAAPLAGSWTRSFFAVPGGPRMAYWLYLPPRNKLALQPPLPLVVMLHGCGQTAPDFAQGTRMNALAQRKGFAVLYPQQLLTTDANRCWQWYRSATQQGGGDAASVVGLLAHVVGKQGLDATRVYLAGLSAGAALAEVIALRYPHFIAAVGMHSGPVFGMADNRLAAFAVMQHGALQGGEPAVQALASDPGFPGMPAMLLHGDADKVVRPVNLHQVARQFCLLNHLPATHVPVTTRQPARSGGRSPRHALERLDYRLGRKTLVSVCRIAGLDHAWSGGDAALRFNSKLGPDASALLWAFFEKHRRPDRIR